MILILQIIQKPIFFFRKIKKVIGKFKDELDDQIMSELVFLRSKAYAFKVGKEVKNLKGITKSTIKKLILLFKILRMLIRMRKYFIKDVCIKF